MCARRPKSQTCPGLHQEKRGQQGEGGDFATGPLWTDTPGSPASSSGALSAGQTWTCWSGSRGGHSNGTRAEAPLLGGKAERVGAIQPGEEKAAGRP